MKIMAPAGSLESMRAAVRAGADEVFMGISGFGARRFAKNFSIEEYCDAVTEAHRFGTAVNVTLNTVMSREEFRLLREPLERLYAAGTDAVIVQDFGFADFLRTHFPDWPIHASTQLSIASPKEARWAQEQGFSRLVLARELSFQEIREIREATSVELEVFASGALCIACSGKCFLSSFVGGRSGNRGMCAQPCRQKYRRLDRNNQERREGFFFSSCDQWQEFPEIARLLDFGVDVIKLEGRMKSPEYVFKAVRYYRELLDVLHDASPERLKKALEMANETLPVLRPRPEIERIFNRGYSKGYLYSNDPDFINPDFSASWGVRVGTVQKKKILLSSSLRCGDGVVFLDRKLQKIDGLNVNRIILESGETVASASRGDLVELGTSVPTKAAFLFRTFDIELDRTLASEMKSLRRRTPVKARFFALPDAPLELELSGQFLGRIFSARFVSQEPLATSQKFTVDRSSLLEALNRFGETPFLLDETRSEVRFSPNVFIPRSLLNQARQETAIALENAVVSGLRRPPLKIDSDSRGPAGSLETPTLPEKTTARSQFTLSAPSSRDDEESGRIEPIVSAAVSTLAQAEICREAGIQKIYRLQPPVHFGDSLRPEETFPFAPLAGSIFDAVHFTEISCPFALDWMFHAANPYAIRYLTSAFPAAETLFLSPELSEKTVRSLAALAETPGFPRLGLVVSGFLYGMFTRKTLFDEPFVSLENQDGRPIYVTRNRDSENPLEATGSRVFYGKRMDLSSLIAVDPIPGISELRLDFTIEPPHEVRKIVAAFLERGVIQDVPFSYGYEKGIF